MEKIELRYQEADLDNVLQYFADQYKAPEGLAFKKEVDGSNLAEWFIDVEKRRVVFKLFFETP